MIMHRCDVAIQQWDFNDSLNQAWSLRWITSLPTVTTAAWSSSFASCPRLKALDWMNANSGRRCEQRKYTQMGQSICSITCTNTGIVLLISRDLHLEMIVWGQNREFSLGSVSATAFSRNTQETQMFLASDHHRPQKPQLCKGIHLQIWGNIHL